jgi:hypothetical protein
LVAKYFPDTPIVIRVTQTAVPCLVTSSLSQKQVEFTNID